MSRSRLAWLLTLFAVMLFAVGCGGDEGSGGGGKESSGGGGASAASQARLDRASGFAVAAQIAQDCGACEEGVARCHRVSRLRVDCILVEGDDESADVCSGVVVTVLRRRRVFFGSYDCRSRGAPFTSERFVRRRARFKLRFFAPRSLEFPGDFDPPSTTRYGKPRTLQRHIALGVR